MKKFVYLISPNVIGKDFFKSLEKVLSYGNVEFFQLRVKKIKSENLLKIAKRIRRITEKHEVKFIINDNFNIALKVKADGCHMGQHDGSINEAKKKLKKKNFRCHLSWFNFISKKSS